MSAEQWMNDLEAKANAVLDVQGSTDHVIRAVKGIAFATAANPAAVKRLVAMTKMMALGASTDCPRPMTACRSDSDCSLCWLEASYQQAEPKP